VPGQRGNCASNASRSVSWSSVNEWAAVPTVGTAYRRPASRFEVLAKPPMSAARDAATAAPRGCAGTPSRCRAARGRARHAGAAEAMALSWLRIERMRVSRMQASANVDSTMRIGNWGSRPRPRRTRRCSR
jgi:hypothetical protein